MSVQKALTFAETCAALGFSTDTFYQRAEQGDPTVVFLLETCMQRKGTKGARRRWDPADVEKAKQMERQGFGRRARVPA